MDQRFSFVKFTVVVLCHKKITIVLCKMPFCLSVSYQLTNFAIAPLPTYDNNIIGFLHAETHIKSFNHKMPPISNSIIVKLNQNAI